MGKMSIACSTDYLTGTGSPEPWLRLLAEAGFTHLHWCHQWNSDFLYSRHEIAQIGLWLRELGLTLLDIHGSAGQEKLWYATEEYRRRSGVELVANRVEMLAELQGTGTVMMHIPFLRADTPAAEIPHIRAQVTALKRSLDELSPLLEKHHICIAVENMWGDTFAIIEEMLAAYPPHILGLCYDSGHANAAVLPGISLLEKNSARLQALHLHDNNRETDQHQPPFFGTVDWPRLAQIIAASPYPREISFELSMAATPFFDASLPRAEQPETKVREFLADAYQRCCRAAELAETNRRVQ